MKAGKTFHASVGLLTLIFYGLSAQAGTAASTKTLDIGIILRLNDKYNSTVDELVTGIETAKSIFEQKNPSIKIILHKYAHTENLDSVVAASNEALNDHIPAIIGGELSEESIVIKDTLGPKKVIFITPTSSNPQVTENSPYTFRFCLNDKDVAVKLANYVIDKLGAKKIAVIDNISSPYTDYLAKKMLEVLNLRTEKKHLEIIGKKTTKDQADYTNEIKDFISHHITHVIMPTHQSDLLRFVAQASALNYFPIYIGCEGWGSNAHVYERFVKDVKNGNKFKAYRVYYENEELRSSELSSFKTEYRKLFLKEPTAWGAIAYDSAWLLFTAMARAHNPKDTDQIKHELLKLHDAPLLTTKHFKFNADQSPEKDLYLYKIGSTGATYEGTLK